MRQLLARIFGMPESTPRGAARLTSPHFPEALYVIGDVHGRLDLLEALEERIAHDAGAVNENVWVVLIGDIVDRGPSSAQVIDHVIRPSRWGFRRFCLSGNHEQAMLEAFESADALEWWCRFGGIETLASYGVSISQLDPGARSWDTNRAVLEAYIPREHVQFLSSLPVMIRVPGYVLVHAGMRPGIAPEDQTDQDLRWFRHEPDEHESDEQDRQSNDCVVHGHTIVEHPLVTSGRIAIDTGAYATGRLTAVRLRSGQEPIIIEQSGSGQHN
ncbi:metallophosphoesterase family protein [Pelagibacterium halotolerans]|uniref:Serine/threonine protein phosphatase I n=1 Tax=Pelagibacterium halotolerans (strain DSM 22347 / JCM 15775 / CGMCC 1.7692 / B2) TaxID=1082931 RepID=G4RGW9_PELHB|nr:metallophosphoesterase family protein [Pelagibacterium halotolerans]AEQ53122.1 serine/threonine protein phosphatase I [Pelagibacterium halotolerans B2]QJR17237.1 serine/threonine protein phosphatase [Pelagibacterium halotolerans]SEA98751.1 serine/threonine protein phosphatase 1 [Pelagibacterium halotolerans]